MGRNAYSRYCCIIMARRFLIKAAYTTLSQIAIEFSDAGFIRAYIFIYYGKRYYFRMATDDDASLFSTEI